MTDSIISFRDVTFGYGPAPVVEGVSLDIGPRELVSVIGPNGGGKTTLLKLILGELAPHAGQVRVFGETPARARPRIGYSPQHPRYDPLFPVTVMDVVLMGRLERHWGGWYSSADKGAAKAALDEVDLVDLAGRPFHALSGGERQRALLARALVCDPELLLLDEPTANVDMAVESKVLGILRRLNERMTIILVSHDLGFVSSVVSTVVCVNRRVVVHPTSEITGEIIQDIYGKDLRMVRHDHRCAEGGHTHG